MAAGLKTPGEETGRHRWPRARRAALLALLLAVAAGHALLIVALRRSLVGWGVEEAAPQRLEVAFVQALTPSRPVARRSDPRSGAPGPNAVGTPATKGALQMIEGRPAAGSVHRSARPGPADRGDAAGRASREQGAQDARPTERDDSRRRPAPGAAAPAASSASAPSVAPSAPVQLPDDEGRPAPSTPYGAGDLAAAALPTLPTPPTPERPLPGAVGPLAPPPEGAAEAASAAAPAPGASAPADDAAPTSPAEIWPPSTCLSYTLTGNYRGAIGGTARVQWVRIGSHYQVQMDVTVGLPFAPLMTRRVTSDGEITEAGLQPVQFDELTKRAFQDPSHSAIHFADNLARMSNGLVVPAPAGTQDSASQFVQLTWLFTLHPDLLQPGRSITFPLALRGRVQPWTYDVLGTESLYTVFGDVPVVHVKPRPLPGLRNVLGIEIWFAPTLQYLPARILVRENAETYIDLVLHELPLQAAAPGASRAAPDERAPSGRPTRRRSL